MAHEITSTDGLVLNTNQAWHGLGTIVQGHLDPQEALKIAGLDWSVQLAESSKSLVTGPDGIIHEIPSKARPLIRMDTLTELGVHRDRYAPIQNSDLFNLAYALGEKGIVSVESAGSILGGARVWVLLKGETLDIQGDMVESYLMLANGHDAELPFCAAPTSVRVVCNNTLSLAVEKSKGMAHRIKHAGSSERILAEMTEYLKEFKYRQTSSADYMNKLAKRELTLTAARDLWRESYIIWKGAPQSDKQRAAGNEFLDEVEAIFMKEVEEDGCARSPWTAANAVTNYIQHRKPAREVDGWEERRMYDNVFGENAKFSNRIVYELAGAF